MRLPEPVRHPLATVLARWGRVPGLRTAKSTLAAVLAYVAADALNTSTAPILAPLTALLVVQLTVHETLGHSLQRILSVLSGVLVAVGIATFVGLSWWSLGAVVSVSLLVGQLLRLGPHTAEVAISAMLVLAVGHAGAGGAAVNRVYETLIGAVIGLVVTIVVAPPVNVLPAGAMIGQLAERQAEFLHGLAGELREGWSREVAKRRLDQARALGPYVTRADVSLARAERSVLLNPRGDEVRAAQPRLRTALTGLEHCYVVLRTLCREIFDRTFYLPEDLAAEAYGPDTRAALADVLDHAAATMTDIAAIATGAQPIGRVRARVENDLAELHRRRDRLGQLLVVDPNADAAAWQQHGALLSTVDRLRVEIEAAAQPPEEPWRPPVLAEKPRQAIRRAAEDARPAVRRVIDAAVTVSTAAETAADDLRARRRRVPGTGTTAQAQAAADPTELTAGPAQKAGPAKKAGPTQKAGPEQQAAERGSDPNDDA